MKLRLLIIAALLCFAPSAFGQYVKILGTAEKSGKVISSGVTSTTSAALTFPSAGIQVYSPTGSGVLAAIYSDSIGTPKSNGFTADSAGVYDFFIQPGATFDVRVTPSGGSPVAFTRSGYTAPGATGVTSLICAGTNDTTLLTAGSALGGTLQIPKSVTCATNTITISAALDIQNGGLLKPLTGQTATLTGPQNDGAWQKFTNATAALGTISFTGNTTSAVPYRIDWWGTPAGTLDTAICQAAATAFPVNAYIQLTTGRTYATEVLYPKQGQTWDLNGATMKWLHSTPLSLYLFGVGNSLTTVPFAGVSMSSGTQGATSVTVSSTATFAAGDRVIVSGGTFTVSGVEEGPIEFNTVKTVTDGTHLALANPLAYNYSASGLPGQTGANVKKLGQGTGIVNHVRITGGTLTPGAGANGPYFYIANTEDIEIDHVVADGSGAGWNSGSYVNRLNFHDNTLKGTPLSANTAMNFASLVYSRIVDNFFTSEILSNGANDVNNNFNFEVTCHDNIIANNSFGPIRGTSVAAIDFNKYSFNNTIVGNRIWGSDTDVAAGIVTLGIRTYIFGTPANTGNIIVGNQITNILLGVGDIGATSVIDGNSLFNTTTHASSVGFQVDSLTANVGVNSITGFTTLAATIAGGTPTLRSRMGQTQLFEGNGSPESVVTAAVGSVYRRLNGGAGTTLFIKESGTGSTGWVAVANLVSPGAIGGTTPAAGTFTTLTANTSLVINGGTALTTTNRVGTGNLVLDTSPTFTTSLITPLVRSTTAKVLLQGTGTGATQIASTQTTPPTCSSNCGTSPSVAGTDSDMRVTMGAAGSPASGFVITFSGTWAAAPVCSATMSTTGMVVGKLPLTVVTTTTTITVVTNGTAPGNSDTFAIQCRGVQ